MILPGMPKGGLLIVNDRAAALPAPLFETRKRRYLLLPCVTLPNEKIVLFVKGIQPPFSDSNSIAALGTSLPVASTFTTLVPPLVLTWTNTTYAPLAGGLKLTEIVKPLLAGTVDGKL
jgi:hypothetical protein